MRTRSRGCAVTVLVGGLVIAACKGSGDGEPRPAPKTYSISGAVGGTAGARVTLSLSGSATGTTTTDASSSYSFTSLGNGSYTITPSLAGYTFLPTSIPVTVSGADVGGANFAAARALVISGAVSGDVQAGVAVNLTGAATLSTTTDATGGYSFTGLLPGSYEVAPSKAGYVFSPPSLAVALTAADSSGNAFVAYVIPGAPTGVSAVPRNGAASVSFTGGAAATSYKIYYAATQAVTAADPKVDVAGSPANVPGLANDAARYFAVSAVNGPAESQLSPVACAVPTASDTTGLALYDGLCRDRLDGRKWWQPGAYSLGVSGGAAALSVDVADQEPRSLRNAIYLGATNVAAGASRVTTISADVTVPAAAAAQTGSSQIRAAVRIVYSPPASRLTYPGNVGDALVIEVGLIETGSGLQAYRLIAHLDDPFGSTLTQAGVTLTDPAGFAPLGSGGLALLSGAPAAYDTTFTVSASYDEGTGVFNWKIAGGTFGTGVSGSADPGSYLVAKPAWSGVSLAGPGFWFAGLVVRTHDQSAGGGGSGRVAAAFDNVSVGLNGAAAGLWDDFSATGGNSGPAELSLAKWSNGGRISVTPSGGSLLLSTQITSPNAAGARSSASLSLADAAAVNTMQADVSAVVSSNSLSQSNVSALQGRFYNDGTVGSTPPDISQPHSAVGDIAGQVFLNSTTDLPGFNIRRCTNANCSTATLLAVANPFTGITVGSGKHTLLLKWDPVARTFTFGVDGSTVTVDPKVVGGYMTQAAPYAGPANAPNRVINNFSGLTGASSAGATGSIQTRVTNVFTAP